MERNLLIVGEDLEQQYHRGIAFYSKSLLKATHTLGYRNYLLTSAPNASSSALKELSVLKNLMDSTVVDFGKKKKVLYYINKYLGKKQYENIPINFYRDIIKEVPRLDYIQNLQGFSNNPYQYLEIDFHSNFFKKPARIDLPVEQNYKAVVTTSPLAIRVPKAPLIQTIHDIIPISTHLHMIPRHGLERILNRTSKMLMYSDLLLSVSEYSRQEVLRFFPGYEDKIKTTHIAVPIADEDYKVSHNELISDALLKGHGLEKGNFLFYVGAIEDRKNIERMIFAYNAIKHKIKIPLVIAGYLGGAFPHLKKLIYESKDVVFLEKIDSISKLILFKSARAFVFPSLYEGFGIPPLEAMYMGCPVLTSNVSSLPEVCGDAALYVNPLSLDDMASQMLLISTNESLQKQLIAKGLERVKQFSNEAYSQRLKLSLDKIIS